MKTLLAIVCGVLLAIGFWKALVYGYESQKAYSEWYCQTIYGMNKDCTAVAEGRR